MTAADEQCCELERISRAQSCCNGQGYNPALQACADVGDNNLSGCGRGTTCPIGECSACVWAKRTVVYITAIPYSLLLHAYIQHHIYL